jgi:hypothetical protein
MRVEWLLALCVAAGTLCATDPLAAADKDAAFKSGLYPGDRLSSFKCLGITGPHKGASLCYI